MGFRDYSESFKTPLPAFSRTEVSLDKLIAAWEKLRELDIAGYRTSQGNGNSAFLVKIACADGTLGPSAGNRSEEHTSELQSLRHLVCRLLLEKKNNIKV